MISPSKCIILQSYCFSSLRCMCPFKTILYTPFKQLLANSVLMQPEENVGSRVTTSLNNSALKRPDFVIYIVDMCAYIILNVCSIVQTQRNPQYYSTSWVFHSVVHHYIFHQDSNDTEHESNLYHLASEHVRLNHNRYTCSSNAVCWMVCSPPAERPRISVCLPQRARLPYCTLATKLASSGTGSGCLMSFVWYISPSASVGGQHQCT